MTLRQLRPDNEDFRADYEPSGAEICGRRTFEEPLEDQCIRENIEVAAAWFVVQVEHVISNRIFGHFAKKKLAELMANFENRLASLGLGHAVIGAVAQQAYERVRRLVSR